MAEKPLPKKVNGKSTKLGHGGRAAKLKNEGVPGAVIGNIELWRKIEQAVRELPVQPEVGRQ